jgi:hypothetical protein
MICPAYGFVKELSVLSYRRGQWMMEAGIGPQGEEQKNY